MTRLYVVATPIGNLEDTSERVLRILREVGLIAAEDTRVTRKLLSRFEIDTPATSYHEHNKLKKLSVLLETLGTQDVALVSDAGMPGVSDTAAELVSAAAGRGVEVVAIPGPSAVTSAIGVSGLPVDQFVFLGFLPRKKAERSRLLASLADQPRTLVAFETPHRLVAALRDILDVLGDRRVAVCREMTKVHEEVFRGTVSEAVAYFDQPRGEFTLVIEGAAEAEPDVDALESQARTMLDTFRKGGLGAKSSVVRTVAETGLPRKRVYALWLETDDGP